MIDTVVLTLQREQFRITNPEKFNPNCADIYDYSNGVFAYQSYVKCYQNMTDTDKKTGNYKPRLTLYRRGGVIGLKVEFSAPKLLFGNNFEELQDTDLSLILAKLVKKLREMGVVSNMDVLMAATVSAVHFGKNVILDHGTSSTMVLSELRNCDLYSRLDVNQTDYRNDGHVLKWHANSYEVVFYDKGKDLEQASKSEKRALENDNFLQLDLLSCLENLARKPVVRMEVRLNAPQKLKSVLSKCGIQLKTIKLSDVFKVDVARAVLLDYWNPLLTQVNIPRLDGLSNSAAFSLLKVNNPTIRSERLLKLFAGLLLTHEKGLRGLREHLGYSGKNSAQWYRLLRDLKNLKIPSSKGYRASAVIGKQIAEFRALKMSDFSLKST